MRIFSWKGGYALMHRNSIVVSTVSRFVEQTWTSAVRAALCQSSFPSVPATFQEVIGSGHIIVCLSIQRRGKDMRSYMSYQAKRELLLNSPSLSKGIISAQGGDPG